MQRALQSADASLVTVVGVARVQRRSFGARWKPTSSSETGKLVCTFPKPKADARAEARLFANHITYADGSKGMQMSTAPRPTITHVRDITNHPLWQFAGEEKADTSDISGQLGRFARRMGGSGELDDRMATSNLLDSIMDDADAVQEAVVKEVKVVQTQTGKKGKKK